MNEFEEDLSVDFSSLDNPRPTEESTRVDPHLVATRNSEKPSRRVCYHPVVLGICRDAIANAYMNPVRDTIQQTLNVARYRVHIEQTRMDEDHEKNPVEFPTRLALKLPTRYLIRSMIEEISPFDRYAARYGRRLALVKFRTKRRRTN